MSYVSLLLVIEINSDSAQSFGGGGISPQAGTILRENGVRLHCSYGGTEFGAIGTSSLKPEDEDDWEYIEFSDICTPRWIPQGDGTYELQFLVHKTTK